MQNFSTEWVKAMFMMFIIALFIDIIYVTYNVNQAGSFEKEASAYIAQKGNADQKTLADINSKLSPVYHNYYSVQKSNILSVSQKTPYYANSEVTSDAHTAANQSSQLFNNENLVKPAGYIYPNQQIEAQKQFSVKNTSQNLRDFYDWHTKNSGASQLIQTDQGTVFAKDVQRADQPHALGQLIYYKIHMKIPYLFGLGLDYFYMDVTYTVQAASQTNRNFDRDKLQKNLPNPQIIVT